MTAAERTPNRATSTHPKRSSKRVARKSPLGWLPWALLGLLALLIAVVLLVINAIDDDGPDGPAGDRLGQVGASDGSGVNGADGDAPGTGPSAGADAGSTAGGTTGGTTGGSAGGGSPTSAADLAALTPSGLVGGAGVTAAPASGDAATLSKRAPGTVGTVLFAEGSAELDAEAKKVIAQAVKGLQSAGVTAVSVSGYTDVVAGQAVNDPLSQERADAVAGALKAALPNVQTTAKALGQDNPVASNDTETGRQQNRRAAIVATP